MKRIIIGFYLLSALFLLLAPIDLFVQKQLHEWGQKSEVGHELVRGLDLMMFIQNGGGVWGASTNYYGYHYAKATADPNRPLWHKALFWENPYYITEPPEKWLYPPEY